MKTLLTSALALLTLAGCGSNGVDTVQSCPERFARRPALGLSSPGFASPGSANVIFDASDLSETRQSAIMKLPGSDDSVHLTIGNMDQRAIGQWSEGRSLGGTRILLSGDTMLVDRSIGPARDFAEAVQRACALEKSFGVARSINLTYSNPRVNVNP